MSLSLVYRAARPSLLAKQTPSVSLTALSTRHASLSAIHRGLVRSEKARPQGARSDRISDLSDGAPRLTYAERRKARAQLAEERPTFKIRKGKKDITEYPDEPRSKSRRARFYDPESSFGKKSLVYQLKTGKLRGELKELQERDGADSAFQRTGPRPELREPPRRARRRDVKRGRDREDREDVFDPIAELSRPAGSRDAPRQDRDASPRDRGTFRARDAPRRNRDTFRDRDVPQRDRDDFRGRDAPRRDRDNRRERDTPFGGRDAPARDRDGETPRPDRDPKPKKDRDPISIPYTTAASQFLYGKSVVEAALRSGRRQLYKLYIYGGANRKNQSDDAFLQSLARRKNVPVTVLDDENGLRLMDKMASSRPHNGFVLEASPLPQPPLSALGPQPDNYPTNPHYPLTLAHQSAEESTINGTPTSIPALSPTHKPLVVILDQILDPGNLGAILRTVSFLGATAVGITRRGSATLTPVALKASAGAAESLTLFSIPSLPEFLNASRANGWAVYAAVAEGPKGAKQRRHVDIRDVEEGNPLRREPCVLLVGNEGEGLDRLTVKKADYEVNIPNLSGAGSGVDSLNVSVAVGLLCSAFLRGVTRELGFGGGSGSGEEVKESLW